MLYLTKFRTQPLFLNPEDQYRKHVQFGKNQEREFNKSDPPQFVGKNQARESNSRKNHDDYYYDEV